MKTIADTGILSDYLLKQKHAIALIEKVGFANICITPVIYIEFRNWLSSYKGLTVADRVFYNKFINLLPIVHINDSASQAAITLSKNDINSKPADTLIAATCLVHKLAIITNNTKHFKHIKGIQIIN